MGAKTNVGRGEIAADDKITSKGLQKRRLNNAYDRYKKVLLTGRPDGVVNLTFRYLGNKMVTYRQKRLGLKSIYMKRIILPDLVSTMPLCLDR